MGDTIFTVISHPARRYVLTYLLRAEGYVTMGEIVDYVITSTDSSTDPQELRREVTVLHHPKLRRPDRDGTQRHGAVRFHRGLSPARNWTDRCLP
ncbi:DUF7344 domain-containing protein [Halovenus halobia]|uniref:DUF7344 domain-containing protein n=1 Tax=Halovenus halobia TaxID=3396622 RepID=UPI003F5520A2